MAETAETKTSEGAGNGEAQKRVEEKTEEVAHTNGPVDEAAAEKSDEDDTTSDEEE